MSDSCMDTFTLVPQSVFNIINEIKTSSIKGGVQSVNILKFIWAIVIFICVFPALPFFMVLSVMSAVVKYFALKFRVL